MAEQVIRSEHIYDGRVVHLKVDTVLLENGETHRREIVEHNGAVALVPLEEDGNVVLVRQHRAGARKELLELPAGGLEPGEPRDLCARRELQEEIGLYPEELIELGGFYVAASYTTEFITIYLARGLRASSLVGDDDEAITVVRMPFEQALDLALSQQIEDGKTVIGLVWAARRLGKL